MTIDPELIGIAHASAERAAARSRVVIRPLTELAEFVACEELYTQIWGGGEPPVPAGVLRAHSSAGSYVVGAYDGDELLGGCLGFWGPPARPSLHSHIAGVSSAARGRDLGYALKVHQRAAALACGVPVIHWTYDPLIARNAHFNLTKLGGRAAAYHVNYYGNMPDAINAGDESDRIDISWELASPRVRAACDGGPAPVEGGRLDVVAIPRDIETLRREDPAAAAQWRQDVRRHLLGVLDGGGSIVGFDRTRCAYLVRRRDS